MKKRWLLPVLLVLVMTISVAGSYAYFTATQTSLSTVSTGTLDILIAASPDKATVPPNSAFGESASPWNFDNLAPGDTRTGCLWLMNTGSLGTSRAYWNFTALSSGPDPVNLADRIAITSALTTDSNTDWIPSMMTNSTWNPNGDAYITLQELANYGGDWMSDVVPFVSVAPGGKGAFCMTIKMIDGDPAVDNDYQGQTLSYQAVVTAQNPAH